MQNSKSIHELTLTVHEIKFMGNQHFYGRKGFKDTRRAVTF